MKYEMNWRSLGDSNPCFRRERATSWAARRRERALPDSRSGQAAQARLGAAETVAETDRVRSRPRGSMASRRTGILYLFGHAPAPPQRQQSERVAAAACANRVDRSRASRYLRKIPP